jgi:hypothetical protein
LHFESDLVFEVQACYFWIMPRSPISNLLPWTCRWTTAGLFCLLLTARVWGQEGPSASPYHLSIKVQVYSPLSWLAEQVIPNLYQPFTPRFWTGELELGFSERYAVFGSLGIRRLHYKFASEAVYDRTDSYRITLGYADYFRHAKRGALAGPFYAPLLRWMKSTRDYNVPGMGKEGNVTTYAGSIGTFAGWKQFLGKHLELSAALGFELGYQWYEETDEGNGERVSTFDFVSISLWKENRRYHPKTVALGFTSSVSVGWKIF